MSSPPGWWDLEKRWSCSILFHLRRVSSGAPVRAAVGEGAGGETLPSACSGRGQPELRSLIFYIQLMRCRKQAGIHNVVRIKEDNPFTLRK